MSKKLLMLLVIFAGASVWLSAEEVLFPFKITTLRQARNAVELYRTLEWFYGIKPTLTGRERLFIGIEQQDDGLLLRLGDHVFTFDKNLIDLEGAAAVGEIVYSLFCCVVAEGYIFECLQINDVENAVKDKEHELQARQGLQDARTTLKKMEREISLDHALLNC